MTYLPAGSTSKDDRVKGTFLLIIIAVPLDLEEKLEWNNWPTHPTLSLE